MHPNVTDFDYDRMFTKKINRTEIEEYLCKYYSIRGHKCTANGFIATKSGPLANGAPNINIVVRNQRVARIEIKTHTALVLAKHQGS
jgi:hypothetical protein